MDNDTSIFKERREHHEEIVKKYLSDIRRTYPDSAQLLSNHDIDTIINMHLDVAFDHIIDNVLSMAEMKNQHKKLRENAIKVIRFINLVDKFKNHIPTLLHNEVTEMVNILGIDNNECEDENV